MCTCMYIYAPITQRHRGALRDPPDPPCTWFWPQQPVPNPWPQPNSVPPQANRGKCRGEARYLAPNPQRLGSPEDRRKPRRHSWLSRPPTNSRAQLTAKAGTALRKRDSRGQPPIFCSQFRIKNIDYVLLLQFLYLFPFFPNKYFLSNTIPQQWFLGRGHYGSLPYIHKNRSVETHLGPK